LYYFFRSYGDFSVAFTPQAGTALAVAVVLTAVSTTSTFYFNLPPPPAGVFSGSSSAGLPALLLIYWINLLSSDIIS
jgi:hypothetical protein